jgi:hypothetical protein
MSYRNLRRRQCECRALAERQLDEASGRPFHNSAELLSIGDALERPDLAPLVRVTLDTAYVASKTNELLDVCACVSCGESWDTLPAGPALALVVMMPEARVGDVNFVCGSSMVTTPPCGWPMRRAGHEPPPAPPGGRQDARGDGGQHPPCPSARSVLLADRSGPGAGSRALAIHGSGHAFEELHR